MIGLFLFYNIHLIKIKILLSIVNTRGDFKNNFII
jgi:hypothetical protein